VQRRRRRLEGGTTRPNVIDQNDPLWEFNTRAYGEDAIHDPSPFGTTKRMQCGHRPRSLEEWHERARECACGCGRDQRGMIEATIAKSRRIGGNWHKGGLITDPLLHGTNRTLQPKAERLCQCRLTVEL
jgi:hypothetical protein